MAHRPAFLIIEPESPEGISSRKLVIETAKLNVITAYSGREGLEMLAKFPAVDGVVVHSGMADIGFNEIVRAIKDSDSEMPVVLLTGGHEFGLAVDHIVSTHDPRALLDLLQSIGQANLSRGEHRSHANCSSGCPRGED